MSEHAGLNQGLFGSHTGIRQPVPFIIVHATRIELCDGVIAIVFVSGSAPQMHNAAIDVVFLNQICDMLYKLMRFIMLQRSVLQKQVVRGISAVHQFVLIGMQLFKWGRCAFVFKLINDREIPHNAQ